MKDKKTVYLQFLLMEKPKPSQMQALEKSIGYADMVEEANFGGLEFKQFAWSLFKMDAEYEHLETGTHTITCLKG